MGFAGLAAFAAVVLATPAFAQTGGAGVFAHSKLKQPVANQVIQRDVNGLGSIPISLDDDSAKGAKIIGARVVGLGPNSQGPGPGYPGNTPIPCNLVDGKVVGIPTGGPYTILVSYQKEGDDNVMSAMASPVFVGDLWVLAGQSNMEGVGDLIDVTPPHPKVMALGMDDKWVKAEEPLHWLVDSPDPVHSGDPKTRAERSAQQHKTRTKGAGLGLPFATAMVESTGVPIGLVITAHGGTSMQQWDPAKKG
jgi:sialate O-acetylesterase